MAKVYNCKLSEIDEQVKHFGLEGQPVFQVALSRQNYDMGEAIICDLNSTYRKIKDLLSDEIDIVVKESIVKLMSINVDIDGYNITMSKKDVIKLMEIFYQFDK